MEEKRKHPRVKTENALSYEGVDETGFKTEQGMGKTLDISQGGLLMETPVPVDAKFILLTSLDAKEEPIQIKGKIVFFRETEAKTFHTGIRFIETNKRIRAIIKEMAKVFNLQKEKQ